MILINAADNDPASVFIKIGRSDLLKISKTIVFANVSLNLIIGP